MTSGGVEYARTTDSAKPGYVALDGPNAGQVVRELPGGATPMSAEPVGDGAGEGSSFDQYGRQTFEGTTAGPGGQQLAYQTTSYYDPQYGWVPHAQLANSLASNNMWDYMNPLSQPKDIGTTQKVTGTIGSGIGSLAGGALIPIPGVGSWIGGKVGGWAGRGIGGLFGHHGAPKQVVPSKEAQEKLPPMPSGSVSLPTGGGGYAPSAPSPTGTRGPVSPVTGQTREWWSPDFGRAELGPSGQGAGGYNLAGPGGGFGQRGTGFGSGTVGNFGTAIGFGGFNVQKGGLGNFGSSGIGSNVGEAGQQFGQHMGYKGYTGGWTPQLTSYWANQPLYGGGYMGKQGPSGARRGVPQPKIT